MMHLEIVNAALRENGSLIEIPPRELAVLVALAIEPRAWPSYQLVPLLWPGRRAETCSSLKVYIHRLRSRFGNDVVQSTSRGYILGPMFHVDLWEALDALKIGDVARAEAFYCDWLTGDRAVLERHAWFAAASALLERSVRACAGAPAPHAGFARRQAIELSKSLAGAGGSF